MPYANVGITRVTSNNANVIVAYEDLGSQSVLSIAVDYTDLLIRMVNAVETISNNIVVMANNSNTMLNIASNIHSTLTNVNTSLVHIDTSLSQISINTNMIRANTEILANAAHLLANLGNTIGITTKTLYDELYGATTYQYLIEKGGALDTTDRVSEEKQELAKQAVVDYKNKVRNLL